MQIIEITKEDKSVVYVETKNNIANSLAMLSSKEEVVDFLNTHQHSILNMPETIGRDFNIDKKLCLSGECEKLHSKLSA